MAFDRIQKQNYLSFDPITRGVDTGVLDIATVLDLHYAPERGWGAGDAEESDGYRMRSARGSEEPPDDESSPDTDAAGTPSRGGEDQAQHGSYDGWGTMEEGLGETSGLLSVPTSTSVTALTTGTPSSGGIVPSDPIATLVAAALEPVAFVEPALPLEPEPDEPAGTTEPLGGQGAGHGRMEGGGRAARLLRTAPVPEPDAPADDDDGGDLLAAPSAAVMPAMLTLPTEETAPSLLAIQPLDAVVLSGATVGMSFQSEKHVFSMADILGDYAGVTYAEDGTIIDTSETADVYTDKASNTLYPIDSTFGYIVNDFIGAIDKERDLAYTEGWAGDITDDDGETVGLALHNAATDTFKSGQPLGTWAAGLGGNSVKASTEHYDVMAQLLSDQAYAEDPDALYTLDNDLRIIDLDSDFNPEVLHGQWVNELTQALETSFTALSNGLVENTKLTFNDIDFNRDGELTADEAYDVFWNNEETAGATQAVAKVDLNQDGEADIVDSWLNGIGTADVTDLLEPNESTTTYDIAVGEDYSVTLKDDGKLLYRWGTIIKRPNDIRMDIKLDLPEEWTADDASEYNVTRAELVITHNITNNPNDQVRPEDYENEDAIGRLPAYYIVTDPDDPENTLWVSPRDAYGGDNSFLPSYFLLDANGQVVGEGEVDDTGLVKVYLPDGNFAGYRNVDGDGNLIGTVLVDKSLVDANADADLAFATEDITFGFTSAWYTTMDRDPFEWSYDANDSDYIHDPTGFASSEEAEAAGFTEDQLVSGPRWRLTSNKFGQDIPGVEIPLEDNSQPPFQHDNIGYPVGDTVTTTLNLLDWDGESPLSSSLGWTTIDPTRLDEDGDGVIDDGWSAVDFDGREGELLGAGDKLPEGTIISAVSPNGQELRPDFFDVSFYLKGDRQDSAKLYDVQLVLEYDTLIADGVFDYGDAPDDGETTFYQGDDPQRAQIVENFYLGAPVDGETVLTADIDAEAAPITDVWALGDDRSNVDDEGNAVSFLTPLAPGGTAYADVTASVAGGTGYLYAWFDLDGDGTWDDAEIVLDGEALTDGSNVIDFTMPDYNISDLTDGQVYARFILADAADGVTAYHEDGALDFGGEIEDYVVQLTSVYDDVVGRDGEFWWGGLSDGDAFKSDNYGRSQSADWDYALVGDLNGDGIDDLAGYAEDQWIYGVTEATFDEAAYLADPTSNYLSWQFDYSDFDGRLRDPYGEAWTLDMNGDGKDEVLFRGLRARLNEVSLDGSFDPDDLTRVRWDYFDDILVGDFNGDGTEELAAFKVKNDTVNPWAMVDYHEDTNRVTRTFWAGAWKPDDYSFVVGDYNGDGMDDIAGRNVDGQWIVSLSLGDRFTAAKTWTAYKQGEVLGGGDADGDGLTDLILYDAAHGQFMVGSANPDEETFNFSQFGAIPAATDWIDMRLGDFDGDGLIDVAARDAATGRWTVAESDGTAFVEDQYGVWEDDVIWQDVMVGNFDATPTILSEPPVVAAPEVIETNGEGNGAGDGTGDSTEDHGGNKPPAPTPPDVLLQAYDGDVAINGVAGVTGHYAIAHTFSVNDILGDYDGTTFADDSSVIDMNSTPLITKDGVELHPIDSTFGFEVYDFIGATDKVRDGSYTEGWAGNLYDEVTGDQIGMLVSDARTDTLQTPNLLGTWLVGMGGSAVKASTEHYTVMQQILSDQAYPEEDGALLPLDDDLWLIDYQLNADGTPMIDAVTGDMLEGAMHGYYAYELVQALEQAGSATPIAIDFDRDDEDDAYSAYYTDIDFGGYSRNVAVVDLGADGSIDYYDTGLNGFGTFGLADVLEPNESTVLENIAVGDDYSVTLKDDGKLLYRWGNLVKRPNDVRLDVTMPLPDEWQDEDADSGLQALFHVTAAELVVNHTVTNNPNDQLRPEDFENEAAIGTLPSYEIVTGEDGYIKWQSTADYYAGDGTLYEKGTVLRDMALVDELNGSLLEYIGATSADLEDGFTNAWYTTMDREPFVAVLDENGDYEVGPRWRLQPDKYGQDLPSVVIPQDPADELPVMSGEEQYEVGADTTTVLNLLDWDGVSPLALSAGWMIDSGEVSVNGMNMSDDFDLSVYIKGDINPVTLYDAELVLTYEAVDIHEANSSIVGGDGDDMLVGQGSNAFAGGAGEDVFVLGYGTDNAVAMGQNEIIDFTVGEDAIGFIGYGLDVDNYAVRVNQENVTEDGVDKLVISLDDEEVASLLYLDSLLEADSFYFA